MMRIALGSDHAGFDLKQIALNTLKEMGHDCEDFGCYDTSSVDYPDIAVKVCQAVVEGRCDRGILVCSTGTGMCIVANKIKGIRAALCPDTFTARRAREHNNANVICLGAWVIGRGLLQEILTAYLTSEFAGGRHTRRLEKVQAVEDASCGK